MDCFDGRAEQCDRPNEQPLAVATCSRMISDQPHGAREAECQETDVLAPTRDGALKRRRLAEQTTAAFLGNEQTETVKKGSFFLKRLQEMRQQADETKEIEDQDCRARAAAEEEERRKLQERAKSTMLATKRKPEAASTSNADFVDAEPWLPTDRTDIDEETWKDLPPEIRWELKQHFRRCVGDKGTTVASSSPEERSRKSSKSPRANTKKRNATGKSKKCANIAGGTRPISDYFQRS